MCCWFCPAPSILSVPNALFVQYCTIYWATYCLKVENFSKLVRLQSLLSKFTPIHIICVTSRFNVSKTMFLLRGPVLQPPPWWCPPLRLFPFIKVCPALGTTAGDRDGMWWHLPVTRSTPHSSTKAISATVPCVPFTATKAALTRTRMLRSLNVPRAKHNLFLW